MIYLKDKKELNTLTIKELTLLYFDTTSEAKNPHMKFDAGGAYESFKMKQSYIYQHQNQAIKIIQLLKKYKISTSYI